MDETSRDRVLRALGGTDAWAAAAGDGDALVGLADLVTLTRLIEELNHHPFRISLLKIRVWSGSDR